MRRISLYLSLLLASSTAFAQGEGVMVLKSDQPYVSPFDKAPPSKSAPANSLFPSPEQQDARARGERVIIQVQEVDKPAAKPAPRPARKAEPVRKKEEPRVAKKDDDAKSVTPSKEEPKETKALATKDSADKKEASVIPPKEAQNPKAALAPPPALAVKEDGLTSFKKDPVASLPSTTASATAPVVAAPIAAPVAAVAATTALTNTPSPPAQESPAVATSVVQPMTDDIPPSVGSDSVFPAWLAKALMFFVLGGLMLLGGWYWVKRQAMYGDPALHDPWFRPVKSR